MWRILLTALVVFLLWKMIMGDWKKGRQDKQEKQKREPLVVKGEMVKDPICGAFVAKEGAKRVRQGDTLTYFCSDMCRDEYLKRLEAGHDGDNGKG